MHYDFSSLILPGSCLLCRQPSHRGMDLCKSCERDLPQLGYACRTCAIPLATTNHRDDRCGTCLQQPPPQERASAAFRYSYPLDHLVQRFKFNGDHAAGKLLGQLFAKQISPVRPDHIVLVPVPIHVKRLRERGYNQARLLADAVSAEYGCKLDDRLLQRTRETEVQSNMSAAARRRNVRNAFSLASENVPGHVAIIDDVVTTGSTTREIAMLLKKNGVERIEVWALARTSDWR